MHMCTSPSRNIDEPRLLADIQISRLPIQRAVCAGCALACALLLGFAPVIASIGRSQSPPDPATPMIAVGFVLTAVLIVVFGLVPSAQRPYRVQLMKTDRSVIAIQHRIFSTRTRHYPVADLVGFFISRPISVPVPTVAFIDATPEERWCLMCEIVLCTRNSRARLCCVPIEWLESSQGQAFIESMESFLMHPNSDDSASSN